MHANIVQLLLLSLAPSYVANYQLFWRKVGRRLSGDIIGKIDGATVEKCLAACAQNENCKSINVYRGKISFPSKCEFFADNKCSMAAAVLQDAGVDHFDTMGDSPCPHKSKLTLMCLCLLAVKSRLATTLLREG